MGSRAFQPCHFISNSIKIEGFRPFFGAIFGLFDAIFESFAGAAYTYPVCEIENFARKTWVAGLDEGMRAD